MSFDAEKMVASFDSASVLHAATVAGVARRAFPHLGNSAGMATAVRVAGRLPWPALREFYTRIGAAEGIAPTRLREVDLDAVASSFATAYAAGPHPAVVIGSSNGAITHLATAMRAPWLPGTVLVPVHRTGDPDRPDQALAFGREIAPSLLERNDGIAVHQMHDPAQDRLMVRRMAYLRTKWTRLPGAYRRFLDTELAPGAPVVVVHDESTWPVTRIADRHSFQVGGRGGLSPQQHLEHPHAPAADHIAPEAEWGAPAEFSAEVEQWARANGHPVVRITIDGPQEASAPVATVLRDWLIDLGHPADRLVVPSFVLADPWRTLASGRVPFWTYFPVESVLRSLEGYLDAAEPFRQADVFLFQHGTTSPGLARPEDFARLLAMRGIARRFPGLRTQDSPRDIGSLARYGPAMEHEAELSPPLTDVLDANPALAALTRILSERGRTIVPSR